VTAANGRLVLRAARRRRQVLQRGARVQCLSVAGLWHAVVSDVNGDELSLQLPEWAGRAARRRHRRVPCEVPVEVHADGERVAGRMVDISLGGASVLLERLDSLRPGVALGVRLPSGEVPATVSTVRAHHHPGLRVVGLAWARLDSAAATWVGRQVAAAAAAVRRSQLEPGAG
jgi:hypothetical protein